MEPQPIRTLPLPHSEEEKGGGGGDGGGGDGPLKRVEEGKKNLVEEGSELNTLGEDNLLIKYGKPVLTPSQLNEFQQQALIFKHLKAGLPVPLHLVIPVWKSVASSFGSDIASVYEQYPSFVGFIPQEFDHRNMIDPEMGRCRRTDGKKWRCSKNVVPYQKYCERHMHRGRQRSRKLVEASQIAYPSGTISAKDSDDFKIISTHSQSDPHPPSSLQLPLVPPSDSKNSKAVPTFCQLTNPSSSNTGSIVANTSSKVNSTNGVLISGISNVHSFARGGIDSATTIEVAASTTHDTAISVTSLSPLTIYSSTVVTSTTNDRDNDVCGSKNSASIIPNTNNTVAATTSAPRSNPNTGNSLTTANMTTTFNNNKNNRSAGWKCDGSNNTNIKRMINRSGKSGNSHNSNVSPGLGFSPKSVLQVLGCSGSYFYRSEINLEPGRCRRTDGKKWRCSRDIVPDQKYCVRHMHRGAKKRVEASQAVTNFTKVTSSVCLPRIVTVSKEADSATLDTNLSISIPASPRLVANDEKSPTSSSDATISDTTITAYENSNYRS